MGISRVRVDLSSGTERIAPRFQIGARAGGRIVLYGETLPVTRLFFTLDYLGLGDRVSVLNGGLDAWIRVEEVATTKPTPAPAPGERRREGKS